MNEINIKILNSLYLEDFLRRIFLQDLNYKNLDEILKLTDKFPENFKNHKFVINLKSLLKDSILVDEMRYEFNTLFVGPKRPKALPYESTYFDYKNMFGKQTMDVRDYYLNAGLKVNKERFDKFPDDYIGFELQYLYYMSYLISQGIDNKTFSDVILAMEEKFEFINKHPSQWFSKFAIACAKSANLDTWKSFGDFLLVYLDSEINFLNNSLKILKSQHKNK